MNAYAVRNRQDGTTEALAILVISERKWAVFTELLPGEGIDLHLDEQFLPGQMESVASGLDSCNVVVVYTLRKPAS